MKTIAFVTRVHPKRAEMLKICIDSIKTQTSDDYIHILYRDDKTENGYGMLLANQSLVKIPLVDVRYVMTLDDDDMIIDPNFVKVFKKIVDDNNPEIVFFTGILFGRKIPPKSQWGKRPRRRLINGFCLAARLDVWKKHIHEYGRKQAGDYNFIFACYKNTKNHFWLNRTVSKTQEKVR